METKIETPAIVPVDIQDILLMRDVLDYQKQYFRLKAKAAKTKKPEDFQEASNQLDICKHMEATLQIRLKEIMSHQNFKADGKAEPTH
jgi:hypothetical protein